MYICMFYSFWTAISGRPLNELLSFGKQVFQGVTGLLGIWKNPVTGLLEIWKNQYSYRTPRNLKEPGYWTPKNLKEPGIITGLHTKKKSRFTNFHGFKKILMSDILDKLDLYKRNTKRNYELEGVKMRYWLQFFNFGQISALILKYQIYISFDS
ncbi:hypothetical protein RhiirA4_478108 [Rhizophagus irregularis]|uniref:Uncharacterized protein n=1 Tax=Rhizophagus irregularis TaxID=588596 RepID=A0A2I1HEF3_9GLOM|nr:hypothetical protein RhiirA4_478108 [Rhizophagus irregularis]